MTSSDLIISHQVKRSLDRTVPFSTIERLYFLHLKQAALMTTRCVGNIPEHYNLFIMDS